MGGIPLGGEGGGGGRGPGSYIYIYIYIYVYIYYYIYIYIHGLCLGIQQLIIYFSWPNEVCSQ